MNLAFSPPPPGPGGYRWYYLDAACGDWTAVAIFMLGSQFSHRYSTAAARGGTAEGHCAVNFALYRQGRRQAWVFSEYGGARVDAHRLEVGSSTLVYEDGVVRAHVRERQAPFGGALEAELVLRPQGPGHAEVRLVDGQPHYWQPLVPRAAATLRVPLLGAAGEGAGYHDTNHGAEPLGGGVQGWDWSREHGPDETRIRYHPWDGGQVLEVHADARAAVLERRPARREDGRASAWGLRLPRGAPSATLESSPFYARLEDHREGHHRITEVADFRRFHRPWVRWMARFRTRPGVAA